MQVPEDVLEEILQDVKSKQDTSNRSKNWSVDLYQSMITDYIFKLTIGTVFFFWCNPWTALFWPPYYYHYHDKNTYEP